MALLPALLNWVIKSNVNTFNMQNIIGYQKKHIKKNLIDKSHNFLAEQYTHNILTAVGNYSVYVFQMVYKGVGHLLPVHFVPGHV